MAQAITSTNVPQVTFGPAGFIAPSEQVVLSGVIADTNAVFGGGLNPALNTPQGQLSTTETAIIGQVNATFVYYTNQVDPAFASGRMQDAIGRIYFITRKPAQPTVVTATCTGLVGTPIPAGSQARAQDGNIYTCTDGGAIGDDGTVTLTFACNVVGPIACPAGQLDDIYQAISGWDSITNPSDGVLGTLTESRAAFEERRQESVAANAIGQIQAIQGAVLGVPNVLDAFSYQNDADAPVTYRGVALAAHSVYVAAVGGTDLAVATAIWTKKGPGAVYNGNTSAIVYDTSPGYSAPYPAYSVVFERPDNTTVQFVVQIANSPLVPADALAQIQTAIINAFAGADGGARARIGSTIFASRYVCPVAALGSWAQVISLQVMKGAASSAVGTASVTGTTMTVTALPTGALAVGDVVVGPNINNVIIMQQLTGSAGGTGTYRLNSSQVAASGAIIAYPIFQNSVAMDIDEAPVTAAPNILLVLT